LRKNQDNLECVLAYRLTLWKAELTDAKNLAKLSLSLKAEDKLEVPSRQLSKPFLRSTSAETFSIVVTLPGMAKIVSHVCNL
jgi:hypothetical protein